jgi:transcriptional regulator GlxA family with amidase domain
MIPRLALAALAAALASPIPQESTGPYLCKPCGAECHFVEYDEPGHCTGCGMELVPLSTIPQVGVLLYEGVEASTSLQALTAFWASDAVRAFTVADSTDPIRSSDLIELVPQFALDEAPPLDVLVVPAGYGAHEDPLLVEWVAKAAERARFVLGVGLGNLVLAQGGLLEGARVPGFGRLSPRVKEWAPQLVLDEEARLTRNGKFVAARNARATLEGALAIVAEVGGLEAARRAAKDLGYDDWEPTDLLAGGDEGR